jgi:hypothetical protein
MMLTKKQQLALKNRWVFWNEGRSYLKFRRTVKPILFGDGAICVQWNGMWLAIEPDGYTHT